MFWLFLTLSMLGVTSSEDVKYASRCEVCKIVAQELKDRLIQTGRTHEIIETGYSIEGKKEKKKYQASELRLLESMEGLCEKMLEYNIHKERTDSTRFAKGMSQTFKTLHGLVAKGVKVDLGMPMEMWDKPPAEITNLKVQCESLLEDHEDIIEEWYKSQQNQDLQDYLCKNHYLHLSEQNCLNERGESAIKQEL